MQGDKLPITDNDIEGNGIVKVEDLANLPKKKTKSRSKKAADADAAALVDGAEVVVKVEKEGRKKKRRGPTGYALIGEGVEDTPADRRARLKAARQTGASCKGRSRSYLTVLLADITTAFPLLWRLGTRLEPCICMQDLRYPDAL